MNRKTFLQRSALFTLAAAGMPRLARAWQSPPAPDRYISEKTGTSPVLVYVMMVDAYALRPGDYSESIPLSVFKYPSGSGSPAESKYLFKRTGKVKSKDDYYVSAIKREALVSGDDALPAKFPSSPDVKFKEKDNVLLETSKGNFTFLKYTPPPADDDDDDPAGCFLTTACTAARNLPDDCAELSILREYRDSFMRPTTEGLALIGEYYNVAPAIVKAVNNRSNSAAIWDHVYNTLVVPAVSLIQAGEKEEAGALYGAYVQDMKEAFL